MKPTKRERQWNLLSALLLAVHPITHEEINSTIEGYRGLKVESSRRQLDRDRKEFKSWGINVEMQNVPNTYPAKLGYIVNEKDYYLKNVQLEPEEMQSLHLALDMVKIGNESLDNVIYKFGGYVSEPNEAGINETKSTHAKKNQTSDPLGLVWLNYDEKLSEILKAVRAHQLMSFKYIAESGTITDRELEPMHLYIEENQWHVSGYDRLREDFRAFRLDRIQDQISFTSQNEHKKDIKAGASASSEIKPALKLKPWEFGSATTEPLTAELWVDSATADWAEHQIGPKASITDAPLNIGNDKISNNNIADGKIFKFTVTSPKHFYRLAASLHESCEVLGESKLREGFIQYLQKLANNVQK